MEFPIPVILKVSSISIYSPYSFFIAQHAYFSRSSLPGDVPTLKQTQSFLNTPSISPSYNG